LRGLIVTGDDFGASIEVNAAIETAHVHGILNTASLMVTGAAAADAVRRARSLPGLHVGLHLALTRAPSMRTREPLPQGLWGAGMRFFFSPAGRRMLASEIQAQFQAFAATGLALDHVNVHNHMHLHPTVLARILDIGRDFGLRAVRLPFEPGMNRLLLPWIALMQRRLRRAGIVFNDRLFGMRDCGSMTRTRVLRLLEALPPGVSEMHFHPATGPWPGMETGREGFAHAAELEALTSADVREAIERGGIRLHSFSSLGMV
jgi:hopanoid biosynthesis associated protein HpnK